MTTTAARSAQRWTLLALFAAMAFLAIFKLPFLFPPKQFLVSSSYVFGFNNSVAILAVAASVGVLTLFGLWSRRREEDLADPLFAEVQDRTDRLSVGWFVAMAIAFAAGTALLYAYTLAASGPSLTWESQHFLHRIRLYQIYGLRPYIDFSAEYGPLLMYPPAWLHTLLAPLGVSREGAYFLCHWLLNVAGLWGLFYVLQHLRGSKRARVIAFIVVGIAGFGPWMGLNGVLLRYTLPFASVLLAHRMLTRRSVDQTISRALLAMVLSGALLTANMLTSPEIAVAFTVGWIAYLVLRLLQRDWMIAAGSVLAFAIVAIVARFTLPEAYYGSLLRFSQGANNLPLLPAAHLLLYLATLMLLVPPLLRMGWKVRSSDASCAGAIGVLCLAMMPGALGRCDPPHVLFYGLVASAILMVRLAATSRRGFRSFAAAYALVFIGLMWVVTCTVFLGMPRKQIITNPPRAVAQMIKYIRSQCVEKERPSLAALDKYASLGLPLATYGSNNSAEVYLFERKRVAPEYFVSTVGVYTEAELDRKLKELARTEFILVDAGMASEIKYDLCYAHRQNIKHWFLYPVRLKCRQLDLDTFGAVNRYIAHHYDVVETVGSFAVLRRRGSETSAATAPSTQP